MMRLARIVCVASDLGTGIIERIANRTCLAEIKRQRIFDHDAISSRPTCFGARTEGRSKGVPRCSGLKARSLCDGGSITQKLRPPQSEVELEFCDDPQIAHALRCQNAADGVEYRRVASRGAS